MNKLIWWLLPRLGHRLIANWVGWVLVPVKDGETGRLVSFWWTRSYPG